MPHRAAQRGSGHACACCCSSPLPFAPHSTAASATAFCTLLNCCSCHRLCHWRRYEKLMLRRIDWNQGREEEEAEEAEGGTGKPPKQPNYCYLVWQVGACLPCLGLLACRAVGLGCFVAWVRVPANCRPACSQRCSLPLGPHRRPTHHKLHPACPPARLPDRNLHLHLHLPAGCGEGAPLSQVPQRDLRHRGSRPQVPV